MKDRNNTPLFTIVTICLNDLENLKVTVASVQRQSFRDYQYLIIDGGSKDNTVEYLKSLHDVEWVSESDEGIYDAMNKAIGLSKGQYINFMNSGDTFYDKSVLDKIASAIDKYSGVQFLYGDVYYGNSIRPFSLQPKKLTSFTLFRGTVCHQVWFMQKGVYEMNGGFDIALRYKADYDFLCRIILKNKISYQHVPICVASYQGGGFSEKNVADGMRDTIVVKSRYFQQYKRLFFILILAILAPVRYNILYHRLRANLNTIRAKREWHKSDHIPQ